MTQHPMQGVAKFSAKLTKDAKEWLEDLAFRFAAVDIDMTTGWKKIYLYFDDTAATWWRDNQDQFKDWSSFRKAFEGEHSPSLATVRATAAKYMADRKQGKSESLTAYYQDKIKLIKIYEPDMPEAQQIEWLQAGMWHTTLEEILKQTFTTTKALKEYAVQLTAKQNLLAKVKAEQDEEEQIARLVKKAHQTGEQPRYVAPYRRNTGGYSENSPPSNSRWAHQPSADWNNRCYQCGRSGHMARDCYSDHQKKTFRGNEWWSYSLTSPPPITHHHHAQRQWQQASSNGGYGRYGHIH